MCYFTTSTNIFKNLATEEHFLRHLKNNILLFYCNTPSVVVGRNQNIFKEVNVEFCKYNGVHIARRRSGGGCVYHDLGNLNISLITSRKEWNKTRLLKCIRNALQKEFHLPIELSERNDLRLLDRKVAGSAYRITAERAYHHTTLLVEADLWSLEQALQHSGKFAIDTKATESVRANVCNLRQYKSSLHMIDICRAICKEWYLESGQHVVPNHEYFVWLDNENTSHWPELEAEYEHLKSIQWIWGEGPNYRLRCRQFFGWGYLDLTLQVERGNRIVGVDINSSSGIPYQLFESMIRALIGVHCLGNVLSNKVTEMSRLEATNYGEQFHEIAKWFLNNLPHE